MPNANDCDPESLEDQFLVAHESSHGTQQIVGAPLSVMPKPDAELEIGPDPQFKWDADRTAEQAPTDRSQ